MKTAAYWIEHLKLSPHPEGGFYKETYRSQEVVQPEGLPGRFAGGRNFSTAIYFLLRAQDRSLFHRIKSDELWHFHAGTRLKIYVLDAGGLTVHSLGPDADRGDALQVVIPANTWFGAAVEAADGYALAGCTVAPGFDFADFELGPRQTLLKTFPDYQSIIELLTV